MEWLFPAVLTLLAYSMWGLCPKLAILYIDPKSAIVWQAVGALLVFLVALPFMTIQLEYHWKGAVFGALAGAFGLLGGYAFLIAISKGKLSTVVMIVALYSIVTALLAHLLLGESLSGRQLLGAGLAVVALAIFSVP